MKTYQIFGNIVGSASDKECIEDVCLQDVKDFLGTLEPDEDFTLEVCSGGGDVFGGIAIANLIKQASQNGNHSTAHVISLAASIASVICSACDKIEMDENSFFMIHLPYGCFIDCNEIQLQKEIETLDRCKKALISFYKSKFDLTEEEIEKLLIAETWIDAKSVEAYKFNCDVIPSETPMKLAASIKKTIAHFNNKQIIESIFNMTNENKDEVEKTEEQQKVEEPTAENIKQEEVVVSPEEVKTEEVKTDEVTEEEKKEPEEVEVTISIEELQKENEALKQEIASLKQQLEEPVDKRVSGMQSKMQGKINDLTKDFTDKINDFKNQLEMKTQELDLLNKKSIELKESLDKAESELHNCVSALEVKNQALEQLNASVNTPNDVKKTDWKNLHGKDFFDWVEKHPNGI